MQQWATNQPPLVKLSLVRRQEMFRPLKMQTKTISSMKESNLYSWHSPSLPWPNIVSSPPFNTNTQGVTIDWWLNWSTWEQVRGRESFASKASAIYRSISIVKEPFPFTWMSVAQQCSSTLTLSKAISLFGKPSAMLRICSPSQVLRSIYKAYCTILPRRIQQPVINPQPPIYKWTVASGAWERHHPCTMLVPQHPDLGSSALMDLNSVTPNPVVLH